MMLKKFFVSILLIILFFSCTTVQKLPMSTAEERNASALRILENPPGTFPVSQSDIPLLLEYSRDDNPAVRQMAVYQLLQIDTASFFPDILPLLLDRDLSVSRNTEELLLNNRKEALSLFADVLKGDNTELKLVVLDLLVKVHDSESLRDIIELFSDENELIVDKAISAASKIAHVNDKILYETL
ncbi:MAG: hypothetical protein JEY91_10440, partial [Spirochaetaceae bacterium]|nr:hypothetical protein [Spirochaetaceae bacterium]